MTKQKILTVARNYLMVAIGTFLLVFGTVIFLTKLQIVAGGVSGIAIIVQHFVNFPIYDYIANGMTILLWIIGLVFIGKDFAFKTLFSSLLYIGLTFLFYRVPFFDRLALNFAGDAFKETGVADTGNLILCGVFGGIFIGGGVAITFLGGGSTGGVDVLQVLAYKHFRIKESISSFILDALVVVVGMISMQLWVPALCGILSSVLTAALIEVVYIRNLTAYQVDIISEKWQEISKYAQDELERGATIIHAEGGYKGDERIILRVVFDKSQYERIRDYIAQIDPNAFVTFTQTNAVYGEGFKNNKKSQLKRKK